MIEEIEREGLTLMHLRNVPTNPNCLGKDARATEPDIKQVFITGVTDVENLERTLYVIRKKIENVSGIKISISFHYRAKHYI